MLSGKKIQNIVSHSIGTTEHLERLMEWLFMKEHQSNFQKTDLLRIMQHLQDGIQN